MKLRTLSVDRFGALDGRRFEFGGGVTVVLGRNERGKSSMRSAIRSALFGYRPTTRDKHPLAHAGAGGDASDGSVPPSLALRARFEFDDPAHPAVTLTRALAPHPIQARATADDDLGPSQRSNDPLEEAKHVTSTIFDRVFCIDADDVAASAARADRLVDELLAGDDAAPLGLSIERLRKSLEAERATLWRPGRRSRSTRARDLEERIAEVAKEAREARRIERSLVDLERDIAAREQTLARDRERLVEREYVVERLLLIERAADITRAFLPWSDVDLDALGEATAQLEPVAPLLAELEDAELELEPLRTRLAAPVIHTEPGDRETMVREQEIEALAGVEAEVERHERRAEDARQRALDLRREIDAIEGELPSADAVVPPPRLGAAIGIASLGIASGAATMATGQAWIGAAGGTLTGAVAGWLLTRPRAQPSALHAWIDLDGTKHDRVNSLRAEADALEEQAREWTARVASTRQAWRVAAESLGLPEVRGAAGDGSARPFERDTTPDRLRAQLAAARRRVRLADDDAAERTLADRDRARTQLRRDAVALRFDGLQSLLRNAVPQEVALESAYARGVDALAAQERRDASLDELRRSAAWSGIAEDDELRGLLADALEDGTFDSAVLRSAEAAAADLVEAIDTERETNARADERLARERPIRPPSEVDSEWIHLREQHQQTLDRHDRLALMTAVLEEAERRYRAEHTPQVLVRASAWLDAITGGRYARIQIAQDDGGPRRLAVWNAAENRPALVGPSLSRGTREQVHLCLRLAAAEALDADAERLPLLLDEALVHWDEDRRAALYPVLGRIGEGRQVFLFTCHEILADEAETALAAQRVDL